MTAPSTHVNVSGTWKKVNKTYVRVGGAWKEVNKAYVRAGGVWKMIGQGVTPGSTTYTSPGTYSFSVPAHNSLVVTLWGGGGAGMGPSTAPTAGGSSKWDGGTASGKPQANGGAVGTSTGAASAGGAAYNGDTNLSGGNGAGGSSSGPVGGKGGDCPNGGSGGAQVTGSVKAAEAGSSPGGGGGGSTYTGVYKNGGAGAGAYCRKTYAAGVYTPGAGVQVIVGNRGTDSAGNTYHGGYGGYGRASISWS